MVGDVGEAGRRRSGPGVGGRRSGVDEAAGSECSEQGDDWHVDTSTSTDTSAGGPAGPAADDTGGDTGEDCERAASTHHHPSGRMVFGIYNLTGVWHLQPLNV